MHDGSTAVFAFRGSCRPEDWGTNSQTALVVLGTAADAFPCAAFPSDARVHAGFLNRFLATLGSAGAPPAFRTQARGAGAQHAAFSVLTCLLNAATLCCQVMTQCSLPRGFQLRVSCCAKRQGPNASSVCRWRRLSGIRRCSAFCSAATLWAAPLRCWHTCGRAATLAQARPNRSADTALCFRHRCSPKCELDVLSHY